MTENYVRLTTENGIGTVEFFTTSHNALPTDILNELVVAINTASNDDDVKVIILKSGGNRTFCAGASFDELIAIDNIDDGKVFFSGFANVINAMRTCNKIIIGAVQGKAVGGGVGIASATDYCLATKYASVKLSELSIGIGPFVIEPAVTRKIGVSAMSQMTINAEQFYDVNFAKQNGLYAQVYETIEELETAVFELATKLASYNPEALAEMKKVIWKGTDNWNSLLEARAEISGKLVLSSFTKQKLQSYK